MEGKLSYQATLEPGGKTFSAHGYGQLGLGHPTATMDLTLHAA